LVVPVSAVPNWESEIDKFAPMLSFYAHMGKSRTKDNSLWKEKDLIITSYATLRIDIHLFEDFKFDYIVLDESQNIKNYKSQTSKAAKVLTAKYRLTLSGTPIENNSSELWSLFDFLMPGYFGSYKWFNHQFAIPIERDKSEYKIKLLKKMIFPFILRRKKEEVEKELPEKVEITSRLQMDPVQSQLYEEMAASYKNSIESEIDENGLSKSSMKIFEAMLRLRQICLFPQLADPKHNGIPSAKFDHFKNLLEDILAENHKVLIFSQFVQALKFIREYLEEEGFKFSYLDGSTNMEARKDMISSFQDDEDNRIFLLSLKAGGVAINLTAADYVIIFDPWWNPAVEAQAIDRSHRIGQTRKVIVYRMVIKNSIEEKMVKLQEQKKNLVDDIISTDSKSFKNLTKNEIINLFAFSNN
jgi:non-specific serine/threonine protein kinase